MRQEVDFVIKGEGEKKSGWIILNRPQALHALSMEMVCAITDALLQWQCDDHIHFVVITSSDERAFCAGGDVRAIYYHRHHPSYAFDYFSHEYRLNHLIQTYAKPYVSVVNGIAFGGGVGLSCLGTFCIATERATFAMPETAIGFFPDVGAGYFLNKAPGFFGKCLGLTGLRVGGENSVYTGFAHHVISSADLAKLYTFLESNEAHSDLVSALSLWLESHSLSTTPSLAYYQALVDRCFSYNEMPKIIQALAHERDPFAASLVSSLEKNAPLSLFVTLEYLLRAKHLTAAQVFEMDFMLSQHFMKGDDFYEGVRAMLIDKDHTPRWQPSSLEKVSQEQVLSYFVPLAEGFRIAP